MPFSCHLLSLSSAEVATQSGHRLLAAAGLGDSLQVIRCIADGADPNFDDPSNGETALHRAAQRKQLAVVEVMTSLDVDADRRDHAGRTPLYFGAITGCIDIVKKLLSHGASLFPPQPCTYSISSSPADIAPSQLPSLHEADQDKPSASSSSATASGIDADEADEAALLALRATCPLAAAAAAGHWPVVATLLATLPPDYQCRPEALLSLRFLVWALGSHRAFPRDVISRLPPRLPRCVIDAVRPAYLATTPLVLATGNDQQQLMQWLLQQGADPELGGPLLLCAGRFCRGSRTCCVSTLLRRGARPHVAWADNPTNSPLRLAAAGDCFSHVHCLVAYGADVDGESARVRQALYAPAPWEAHLDLLMQHYGNLAVGGRANVLCPCGQRHTRWPGLWPQEEEVEMEAEVEELWVQTERGKVEAGASGSSCYNRTPADDAWYRCHCAEMEQLQDGNELAECRKAVDELWRYGCSAVVSELGGPPSAPHCLMPQRILTAMQDVAGSWLVAAARCREQRQFRANLYDKAVAAGRALLDRKRVAALAALSGKRAGADGIATVVAAAAISAGSAEEQAGCVEPGAAYSMVNPEIVQTAPQLLPSPPQHLRSSRQPEGLVKELKLEILALAGLAPPGIEPSALRVPVRAPCSCLGCRK